MANLRPFLRCIGLDTRNDISLFRQFFGYNSRASFTTPVSVRQQIQRLKGRHVHLNLIRVGSDRFTQADIEELDQAVKFTRDTYAQVGVGVGRVQHFGISTAEARGRAVIEDDGEAGALTDEWSVPNDGVDVFCVRWYIGAAGSSLVGGSCDKDAKGAGVVIEMNAGGGISNFALAHEVCHYLGNDHRDDPAALMNDEGPNNGGTLNTEEGDRMKRHCFARNPCS